MRSLNLFVGRMDSDPSAEFLQQIDAGPSVRRIQHEMHRSVRFEHAAESSESCVRVRKVMENSGAHNLIKGHSQFVHTLDGKLVDLEVVQVVFSLELLSTANAHCAEVDADNLCRGPTQSMLSRLRCSAAGNEDRVIFLVRFEGPKQMIISSASLSVLPEPSIFVKALDRSRIGKTFVKIAHFI